MKICRRFAAICLVVLTAAPVLAENGYVGCSTPDEAYFFDLDSYAVGPVIDLLPEGDYPYDATISPWGHEVWIPGAVGDGVIVLYRPTGEIVWQVQTGEYPVSVAFTDDGTRALVSCRDSDRVDVVSTNTYHLVHSIPVPNNYLGPGNIALDPVSRKFYLVEWYDDTLYEIDPDGTSILRQTSLGDDLWQLVVDPGGELLYVTDRGTDLLRVIDLETLTQVTAIPVGDDPWGVDVTLDGSKILVCCEDDHSLHLIDTSDWSSSVISLPAQADPRDLDILDEDGLAFVAGGDITGEDPVYVVDLDPFGVSDVISIPGTNTNVVAAQAQVWSGMITAVEQAPEALARLDVYPNPFNPQTRVRFRLATPSTVKLTIHDPAGRRLDTLAEGPWSSGEHEIAWHGRDLPSGLYFVRLTAASESRSVKAILLK